MGLICATLGTAGGTDDLGKGPTGDASLERLALAGSSAAAASAVAQFVVAAVSAFSLVHYDAVAPYSHVSVGPYSPVACVVEAAAASLVDVPGSLPAFFVSPALAYLVPHVAAAPSCASCISALPSAAGSFAADMNLISRQQIHLLNYVSLHTRLASC